MHSISSRREIFFDGLIDFERFSVRTSRSRSDRNPALEQAFREVISGSGGVVGRLLPLLRSNMVSGESGDLD